MEAETGTAASRVIFINSLDARGQGGNLTHPGTSFTTTDFKFHLQQPIAVPAEHSIVMSLHSCSIPYTFYNFRRGINDMLRFSITATGVAAGPTDTIETIYISPGSYNAISMITEIQKKLEAHTAFDGKLHIRYNPDTTKYEWRYNIAAGHPHGHRLTLRLTQPSDDSDYDDDISAEIGFDEMKWSNLGGVLTDVWFDDDGAGNANSFTFGNSYSSGGTPLTYATSTSTDYFWNGDNHYAPAPPINYFSAVDMLANNHSLFVRTNLSSHSVQDSTTNGAFSSILAKIPVDKYSGDVITLSPTDGAVHQLLLKIKMIDTIFIRLTDRKNRLIDLNGLDWNIALQLDFIETPKLEIPKDKRLAIEQKLYEEFKKNKEDKN